VESNPLPDPARFTTCLTNKAGCGILVYIISYAQKVEKRKSMASKKKHLVRTFDGRGAANNARACEEWAREKKLGRSYEVRPTGPASNYVQEYGVYVTDAGLKKLKR
jgi:hypothetical protein